MPNTEFDRRAHPERAIFSTWEAPDGWVLRRMDWPQANGADVRGSLLFAGGRGDFIEKYLEPLAHWHALGWNVSSFDWRSQGQSQGEIKGGHLDSFEPLIADGEALLKDWIGATPGPHVAIGHSMGGHLLLRLLAEHAPKVEAAVLVAPMIGINSGPLPLPLAQGIAQTLSMFGWNEVPAWRQSENAPPGSARQMFLTSCHDRYSDELWWLERNPAFALGPPSWGWLTAAYRSIALLTPEVLARVEVPVLIVGAEKDRLVSAPAIRSAAEAMPNAELLMFEDAAHEILREADSIRLQALARIDAFLEENAPA